MAKAVKGKKAKTSAINLSPTAGYVLIEPSETQTKTDSGIYLPENATTEKPQKGKVLACGYPIFQNGREIECPAEVGDTVVYKKWGGSDYKDQGKELVFVEFKDILAIEK